MPTTAARPMTAKEIIDWLMAHRWRRNVVLPNYTPPGWWECDVFEITEAGYFREYEVKLSLADFRADRRKEKTIFGRWDVSRLTKQAARKVAKHELLAAADAKAPSRFWYAAPEGVIPRESLPPFAGLFEFTLHPRRDYVCGTEVVKAPPIHREKSPVGLDSAAVRNCYFRYHELRESLRHGRRGAHGVDDEPAEYVI